MQVCEQISMTPFDFQLRTRMVFGPDAIDQLGELAKAQGARRVLVVSDSGLVRAGHVDHGLESLKSAELDVQLFDGAHETPTTLDIEAGLSVARDYGPDLLVGLGGGSSMDCAKGINFVYSCGGKISDYWGVGKATGEMLPMIAVPTTAGTGSEMQSFALVSDADTYVKMACGDRRASCRVAILDPRLTLTQPTDVTALTGIDAISHALETYVTKPRNPVSIHYSREAWRLLAADFCRVLDEPENLEARAGMQIGAAFAGVAIENSMLGASHALANPLTAKYDISHGQAVGVMLPHVIRFNAVEVAPWYDELLNATRGLEGVPAPESGTEGLVEFVTQMVARAGLKTSLQECGVQRDALDELSTEAAKQWTGNFNPRDVDQNSLKSVYEQAFDPQ